MIVAARDTGITGRRAFTNIRGNMWIVVSSLHTDIYEGMYVCQMEQIRFYSTWQKTPRNLKKREVKGWPGKRGEGG